jgi:hypothetical protein
MGLKGPEVKEGEAGQPGAGEAPPVTPAAAPHAAPPPAAPAAKEQEAKAEAPKKGKGRTVILLAATRTQSDPFTGVRYTRNIPKPAIVSEGNWIDCQMKAGLLIEYVAPKGDE